MSHDLQTLEDAISDVGMWSWWAADGDMFQVEFAGVQLWNPPVKPGAPPSGQIALRFIKPRAVIFLTHPRAAEQLPDDWPALLQNDELDRFTITSGEFTLTEPDFLPQLMKVAATTVQPLGNLLDGSLENAAYIGFWAGPVGLIVVADEMKIFSHHGEIALKDIPGLSRKWWNYWREYWRLRDSDTPPPQDYACEVTIPAGE